jgi:SAM-dependent methyltransferase
MARQCSIERRPGVIGRTVSAQAARPHGILGRALGHLWIRETAAVNDRAVELLGLTAGDSALEVGCGPGRAVDALARAGVRVTGVDPSAVMLAQARRRNRAAVGSGRVRLLEGAVGSMPELSETVDACLAVHTIYFWPDLADGLRELGARLKPGGRVVIAYRPAERGRPRRLDPAIYRIPTSTQLADALRAAGFVALEQHDVLHAAIVVAHTPAGSASGAAQASGRRATTARLTSRATTSAT